MIAEISIAIMVSILLVLVGSLIFLFLKIYKIICEIQSDFHHVSSQATELIGHLSETIEGMRSKNQLLNFLSLFNKKKETGQPQKNLSAQLGNILELIEWISVSLSLIKQTKEFLNHAKSRE